MHFIELNWRCEEMEVPYGPENRAEIYAGRLSRMLSFETVSREGEHDPELFHRFYDLLEELFPALFAAVEREEPDGCLLLRWKGRNPGAKPVLFMNHSDTVEAQEGWKYPPFEGRLAEGKVWGRGALDTKGGLWGMLQAADELCAAGFVPECDIYFESSCCEEISTAGHGAGEVARLLQERGLHFSFALDEGGMILYEPIGGVKAEFAMIGVGERGCGTLRFVARGGGGHASAPDKNTPLVRLGRFMAAVENLPLFRAEIAPALQEMLRRFAPFTEGTMQKVYAKPEKFDALLKAAMPRVSATSRAMVQSTVAFTMAGGSEGLNVIPAEAWVMGNLRSSHHQKFETCRRILTKLAARYKIDVETVETPEESRLSDYGSAGFLLMEQAVDAAFPGVHTAPYIMTGCSDARFMDSICDNCYRFVPFRISEEQMESIHGLNECVDVSTLPGAVDFYRYLMEGVGK